MVCLFSSLANILIMLLGSSSLSEVYASEPLFKKELKYGLQVVAFAYAANPFFLITSGILRGINKQNTVFRIVIVSAILVFTPSMALIFVHFDMKVPGYWLSILIHEIFCTTCNVIYMNKTDFSLIKEETDDISAELYDHKPHYLQNDLEEEKPLLK